MNNKWMRVSLLALGLIILGSGYYFWQVGLPRPKISVDQNDAVYEIALRHAVMECAIDVAKPHIFFVRLGGKDPSPKFLSQIKGFPYEIRPGSRAQNKSPLASGVFTQDIKTKEKGVLLNLTTPYWRKNKSNSFDPKPGDVSISYIGLVRSNTGGDVVTGLEISWEQGEWKVTDRSAAITGP